MLGTLGPVTESKEAIAAGMRRQLEQFHAAVSAGMPRIGWKIGASDPAAQERMRIPEPLLGWLDGRRVIEEAGLYMPPAGTRPLLEAEVALRLSSDVPAGASRDQAAAAIADIAPAFEFVDAAKPSTPLEEMVAHDILHEGVLFGLSVAPQLATGIGSAGLPRVTVNGELRAEGAAGRVPDDLAESVAFAANILARFGEKLRSGDRLICGTYITPFAIGAGDEIEADFGPLGRLRVQVA